MLPRSYYRQPGQRIFLPSAYSAPGVFDPRQLFAAGEQGAWYDPSDLSTLFQNAAGTTPVTGVEQPVRLMLDKSGRGNHATAPSDAARPVLRARVNLLERTEELTAAIWTVTGISSRTANTSTATLPNGQTVSLTRAVEDTGNTAHRVVHGVVSVTSGASLKASAVIKGGGVRTWGYLRLDDNSTHFLWFNLSTGALGTVSATVINPSVTSLGNGAWLVSFERISNSASFGYAIGHGPADATPVYSGDGSSWFEAGATDLRVTNDGVNLPPYQRVTTSTDYDTAGFPLYLAFDGTDDSMSTGSIDFSGTDKMTVFAGVRRFSNAQPEHIAELSATIANNNGTFLLAFDGASPITYSFSSKGTTQRDASGTGSLAPITHLLTGIGDIAGDVATLRVNGAQAATNTSDQGSGNYGNFALFIASRNNTSARLSGRLYSLIVRGAESNAAQIAAAETWVNGKTRAY
jgi:hypothetical protein